MKSNELFSYAKVSNAKAKLWFKCFRNGKFSLQDDLRSGGFMKIDLAELKQALESEPDQSTRNIASKLGCIHYRFKQLALVSKLSQ